MERGEVGVKLVEKLRADALDLAKHQGKLIIYPKISGDELHIRLKQAGGGVFFFAVLSRREVPHDPESQDEMIIPDKVVTFEKVINWLEGYLQRQYPQVSNLPIYLWERGLAK